MRTKLLLNILLCCTISSIANADTLAQQIQQINQSSMNQPDDLWQRMNNGFTLDHRETKEVKYWEKRYGSPKYFNIIMQNAAPYLYFVIGEMERRGIPLELALIPIVESTYNPNAISPAAVSTGMWQFLAGSGKRFGMTLNSDIDERKDIVKSTRGAINYLQYLHDLFGSWELAIAAYNWGEGNINNALNSSSSRDFYDLDVRDITHQYVPKVLALANIIQNPQKFGIKLIDLPNRPYFAITYPITPVTVSSFMSQANMSAELNKKLNPQYNSLNYTVSNNQRLLLPIANQATYLANIGQSFTPITSAPIITTAIDNSQDDTTVNASDPIGNLMAQQSSSATQPASIPDPINVAAATAPNSVSDLLNDNTANVATATPTTSETIITNTGSYTNYTVAQGDTLYSISKKFSVNAEQIKADNQLNNNDLSLNQQLMIRNN